MVSRPNALHDLVRLAQQLNRVHYASLLDDSSKLVPSLKSIIDTFNPNQFLIVYGSLAPGQPNFHEVSSIKGEWLNGQIHGYVKEIGWGANIGYPGLSWDPNGPEVNASILHSKELSKHWKRLDGFEGDEYNRTIIPFKTESNQFGLGHVYGLK